MKLGRGIKTNCRVMYRHLCKSNRTNLVFCGGVRDAKRVKITIQPTFCFIRHQMTQLNPLQELNTPI